MFTSISWNDYLFFITTVLFLYYTIIAIWFYKWELLSITGIRRELPGEMRTHLSQMKQQFIEDGSYANNLPNSGAHDHDIVFGKLKLEITALFDNSPETISSNKLSDSLNAILSKYSSQLLQQRQDLSRFIYEEAGNYFPGLLTENDVEQLWFG